MTNSEMLKQFIAKSGLKYKFIAQKLKLSYYGLQKKIDGKHEFKASEISTLCSLLRIETAKERDSIFFALDDDFKSTKERG